MKNIIDRNNILFRSSTNVTSLCAPLLDHYNITFFRYTKIFKDNSRIILSNIPDVINYIYDNEVYTLAWLDNTSILQNIQTNTISWATQIINNDKQQDTFSKDLQNYFKLSHGIALIVKNHAYIESYEFASEHPHIYYIKQNIFNRFLLYFKENANGLIEHASSEKIYMPKIATLSQPDKSFNHSNYTQYLEKTKLNKYYLLGDYNKIYLTKREVECIRWSIYGKTADETAIILGINKKTVETNFENIRIKLNCTKQSQIIAIVIKSGIIDLEEFDQKYSV